MKFILGKKIAMTQFWKDEKVIPVTLIEAGPCQVLQIKTKEKDGYEAVQIGFLEKKKIKKTEKGKKFKYIREFLISPSKAGDSQFKKGDKVEISVFKEGEKVSVSGNSKGKGFQGAVKRWGFKGRNATHGVKHEHRTIGSVGCRFPQRIIKGKKMPGRMGNKRITVKNLEIVKIEKESHILALRGAVPGRKGTLLEIKSVK